MQPPSFIWVLWNRYYDGSGSEVIRAYTDERRAMADRELVGQDSSKEWMLTKVPQINNNYGGDK